MVINKATTCGSKLDLFAPIMADQDGKYIAVLSDTSLDRDNERVGVSALIKIQQDLGYTAGLVDHDNRILNQVCEWTNKRIKEIDGHTALIAEPKFFISNPKAIVIMGMLDEGAQMGISIGAIVKDLEENKEGDEIVITYTDLELLEASFVAVPCNKHGRAMAVAKSFNYNKEAKMSELTQKDIDLAVKKVNEESEKKIEDLTKSVESKDEEIAKLTKELEESKEEGEEKDKTKEEDKEKLEESEKKLKETEAALVKEKKESLEKIKIAEEGTQAEEDITKALEEGKLPVMRF